MKLKGKIVVVTGAGSGIGRALVKKFSAEGAKQVIAVDIDQDNLQLTEQEFHCVGMAADVTKEDDILRVIQTVELNYGPIDLFCSNAGVMAGFNEQSPNHEWQLCWDVNVMAHVLAARHLAPLMIERGGGYFLHTASAAGLLNQIGVAAYGVTKHAAVGFAEWLSMTYAHKGIKVSVLCPQAVRTAMTDLGDDHEGLGAAAGDGMMEPDDLADIVVNHLNRETFLILPHPEVETYMQRKTADYNRWISGMNRLHCKLTGEK